MNQVMDARRRDTLDIRRDLEAVELRRAELEKEVELLNNENVRYREMLGDVC